MKKPKPKKKERPITAQPVGDGYFSDTTHSMKRLGPVDEGGYPRGPAGSISTDSGCYRRVPRYFDD